MSLFADGVAQATFREEASQNARAMSSAAQAVSRAVPPLGKAGAFV
jgi:hypothetical protein